VRSFGNIGLFVAIPRSKHERLRRIDPDANLTANLDRVEPGYPRMEVQYIAPRWY
jgi:hypothetical protein